MNLEQQTRTSKLDRLSAEQRTDLIERLLKAQNGLCHVCREVINLQVHEVDVDHICALARGGQDDEVNWGLTHASCNRSKGTRDLQLQRILHEFRSSTDMYSGFIEANTGVTLGTTFATKC